MCKKIQSILFVAMVSLLAMSCTKEQSSLSIEDVPGKVKIMGYVYYNAGTEYSKSEDKIDPVYSPAVNKKIFVEIPNSVFKPRAEGVVTYQTTTDMKGEYQIEIPMVNQDIEVTIKGETFLGEREMFVEMVKERPTYETEDVVYSFSNVVTISSNVISVIDIKYEYQPRDIENR